MDLERIVNNMELILQIFKILDKIEMRAKLEDYF